MKFNNVIALMVLKHLIRCTNSTLTEPHTLKCEYSDKLRWLWNLRNNNRCLNVIVDRVVVPKCVFDWIFDSNYLIRMNDLKSLKSRNVKSFQRSNCDNFMIFTRKTTDVVQLFTATNSTVKRFVPFSQLYLVPIFDTETKLDGISLRFIYENGLFVYVIENSTLSTDDFSFPSLRNVLTDKILNLDQSLTSDAIISYFGTYRDHPVLNANHERKIFRVSFFNCSPYVFYLPDGSFDGIEYRLLKVITRNWTIEYNQCDTSDTIRDPYGEVRGQVENHKSDLAMCSVWLNEKSNTYLDVTNYINRECVTFLVPRPNRLNPATYLYKSISLAVRYSIVMSLIVMPIFFTAFARIGRTFLRKSKIDFVHIEFNRSVLDTFGIFTGQSILKFPRENTMKFLFYGWTILSFLIGIIFSTGYTSLLTKPIFSKPIDSVVDFLDNDLVFDRKGKSNLAQAFFDTGVDNYIKLSKRNIEQNGTDVGRWAVESNKMAYFTKILSTNYLTDIDPSIDPNYQLRLMKSCLFNQYTVVALQKYSSYTQYFRAEIGSLQQSGIISHWRSSIEGGNNKYMRPYFMRSGTNTGEPHKISLQNLTGAFWLLLGGHLVALTVLIAEIFFFNCKDELLVEYCE